MSCENPIRLPNPKYKTKSDEVYWRYHFRMLYDCDLPNEFIEVPCGRCNSCRKSKSNGWYLRLLSEYDRYPNSLFITLTFDNDNLKKFEKEPNKAVLLFLDRMRKRFGKSIRHFIIGEFGEKSSRFHYHGILFNVPELMDVDVLSCLWKYGYTYIGWCNKKTIRYILKYIVKIDPKTNKQKKIPRLVCSRGIGLNFINQYSDSPIKSNLSPFITSDKGYKIPLPRYLKQKLYSLDELEQMQVNALNEPFKAYLDGKEYTDRLEYIEARKRKFAKNKALGLSEEKEPRKRVEITPITLQDVPFDPFDTMQYTCLDSAILESLFEIENTPF